MIPLGAAIFHTVGRHPVAGLAAAEVPGVHELGGGAARAVGAVTQKVGLTDARTQITTDSGSGLGILDSLLTLHSGIGGIERDLRGVKGCDSCGNCGIVAGFCGFQRADAFGGFCKGIGSGLAVAAQVVQVFFRHVQSPEK